MRRLLQGDVGSGKTIVALQAAIVALRTDIRSRSCPDGNFGDTALPVRAEILEALGYRIVLLTRSLEDDRKRNIRRHIAQGNAQLVIGTHALIQGSVEFDRLGLVVVDEQHRFGVLQRFTLMKKGTPGLQPRCRQRRGEPHVLVMTATPIPRTLALTLYGDLDISVLDELHRVALPSSPDASRTSGRRSVELRSQAVDAGRQAYVVYPVIEENEETK